MPLENRDFRERVDACRAGSNDLALPEMEEVARRLVHDPELRGHMDRIQRLDVLIGPAMQRVSVPDGLADRLLRAVEESPVERGVDLETAPPESEGTSLVHGAERPRLVTRRFGWRSWAMASASLAAALFAAFLLWPDSGDAITVENVSARVKGWNASLAPDARHWHVKSTPAEYPLSSGVILPPPVRWQRLSNTASGERVVCYDLAGPGQSDVRLFVVLVTRTARLNASPPAKPLSDSQGVQVAAWQEWRQGRCVVYALVVDGSTSAYENLVRHRRRFASAALPLSPSA